MPKPPSFEIIAGSYEDFLLGYNFTKTENSLNQSFAAHDHSSSIRCVAFSGRHVASGGSDDRIFVYDLKTRKQQCTLTHNNSTVNCLRFTENHSHLISGTADGVLSMVRVGNWKLEKVWEKAHKGAAILDIAVHSSDKMALTLGADCSLITWNLVKGRQAFIINLNSKSKDPRSLEKIVWGPDGVRFILYGGRFTELWSIETGGVLKYIEHKEKVTCCTFMGDDNLLVGFENGDISLVNIETEDMINTATNSSRVKSICLYKKWIVACFSNGALKVFNKNLEEVVGIESGCRLTCMCIIPPIDVKKEEDKSEDTSQIEEMVQAPVKVKKQVRVVIEVEDDEQIAKSKKRKMANEKAKKIKKKK